MQPKPKQIKSDHQLASDIARGLQHVMFRFFDEKNISVGDELELVDKVDRDHPSSWQALGLLKVIQVLQKSVGDLSDADWPATEYYPNKTAFIVYYSDLYHADITDQTPVKIVKFNYEPYPQALPFLNEHSGKLPAEVKLYGDGGSRGNPGPSAGGFVVLDMADNVLHTSNKYLGITTNNQAEYHSLKGGMELCLKNNVSVVHVYMDSLLVINQMKGIFKVKNRDLWPIHDAIKKMLPKFKHVDFTHVMREYNKLADAEVNKALDAIKNEN